jgi:lysophospholipase L1-like esterase
LLQLTKGANDATLEGEPQHVPVDRFKANLSHIISLVRSPISPYYDAETRVLLITCPPVMEKAWTAHLRNVRIQRGEVDVDKPARSKESPKIYSTACKEVAQQEGVPVVDLYTGIIDAAGGDDEEKLAPFF